MTNATIAPVAFTPARRVNRSLTAAIEKRSLIWMAERAPRWLTSDQLTILGLAAQFAAGLFYWLSRFDRKALLLVVLCVILNWVRQQQRPRYGFYVDHMVDIFGAIALMSGLGSSGLVHWQVAIGMLVAFMLLSSESYLATYTLSCFELSQGIFGPTEIRILLILGNLALLHSPYCTVLGHRVLLFDLGGTIGAIGMFVIAILVTARHTAQLFRQEPLA